MPEDQSPSSDNDSTGIDANINAVMAEITSSKVPAIISKTAPPSANPSDSVFVIWLIGVGRFCLTVQNGRYDVRRDSWYLDAGEGYRRIPSPLAQAWDETVVTSRKIRLGLGRWVMIAPAVAFLDMEPDAGVRRIAERSQVVVVWGLDGLVDRLLDAALASPQENPPSRKQADAEKAVLENAGPPATGPPE